MMQKQQFWGRLADKFVGRNKPAADAPEEMPLEQEPQAPADPNDTDALVHQMLGQGRCSLLMRPQVAAGLTPEQLDRARESLEEAMALVPDGEVLLGCDEKASDDDPRNGDPNEARAGRVVRVEPFFLDRYPVTNRMFRAFVDDGGYEQLSLWEQNVWPAVLDFVDQTGTSGPRYWSKGCYPQGLEEHPVVGVSWYEASAYSQWLGKRLPTDAEWVKSGCWPVAVSSTERVQRRYPWGDMMDHARTNLWASGWNETVPVGEFPEGVSVGGVYQLIGNVWEWTRGDFNAGPGHHPDLVLPVPMKSIRGGAFDTYFDNQATCQFQSGEVAMARKPNIGFRCVVGMCDLTFEGGGQGTEVGAEAESPASPAG